MKKNKLIILGIFLFLFNIFSVFAANDTYNGGDTLEVVGKLIPFAGTTIPNLYIEANGQSLETSKYPELFSVIGYTYGGSGATFNLPNLNGKLAVGVQRNINDASYSYFTDIGKSGGQSTVGLTVDTMPSHTHAFTGNAHAHTFTGSAATSSSSGGHTQTLSGTAASAGAHSHSFSGTTSTNGNHSHPGSWWASINEAAGNYGLKSGGGGFGNRGIVTGGMGTGGGGNHSHTLSGTSSNTGAHTHNLSGTTGQSTTHTHTITPTGTASATTASGTNAAVGGGAVHNNLMPYMVMKYIIKYK